MEKNGKVRIVSLPKACRDLLADWLTKSSGHGRRLVFPSRRLSSARPVHKSSIWRVCRGVFQRAGLKGPHVHPHTFRHTVIKILHMSGVPFERIAKWIGHSNANITSNIYGRLKETELQQLVHPPFADDAHKTIGDEWKEVARLIRDPYNNNVEPPPSKRQRQSVESTLSQLQQQLCMLQSQLQVGSRKENDNVPGDEVQQQVCSRAVPAAQNAPPGCGSARGVFC